MSDRVSIDELAEAVMNGLREYADLATEDMKAAVKHAGKSIRSDIQATAPRETGAYAKSWAVRVTRETPRSLVVTVYSRNRYQLTHLLENGHAKRNGGRVSGKPHIAPAEERGSRELLEEIERCLRDG